MAPQKDVSILTPGTCKSDHIWEKGFCQCISTKGLVLGSLERYRTNRIAIDIDRCRLEEIYYRNYTVC